MRARRKPLLATILVVTGVTASLLLFSSAPVNAQMGGHMGAMHGMHGMTHNLPPPFDPAALPEPASAGARVLTYYCTQCHHLPSPGMHSAAEWPQVIHRMSMRTQMMARHGRGVVAASPPELEVLLAYLQTHAQQPLDHSLHSALATPAGEAFAANCQQCHALPAPQQHTQSEWPAVVSRMQENMTKMGWQVPDEATLGQVLDFLNAHARDAHESHGSQDSHEAHNH